jgi:uncharacterized protein YoxC
MSTVSFTGTEVLIGIGLIVFIVFAILIYRLISEIIRTLRQIRRTVREMERTIQNSQEIIYNVKSITRTIDDEVKDMQELVDAARGTVQQIHSVATAVTKPVAQFRNLLSAVGYGAKYLFKRKPSYEYEDE